MKITTLLIALGLTLQLGASSKPADVNASATATAVVGLDGETDRKSAEADVKSSSATPASTRSKIKRSSYPFWNINQETPEEREEIKARMKADANQARLIRAEQRIDEVIIPQAIKAANAGDFEDLWRAYQLIPGAPLVPAHNARIEIMNALFQMDSPWAANKQYSDEERELRTKVLRTLGKDIGRRGFQQSSDNLLLQIPELWLNFLLYPILDKSYYHPYELACEIEHNSDWVLFRMEDPWAIRGLLAQKYKQFGLFELYMITALLGKNGGGNCSQETRENDLKKFNDEQRRVLHNVGGSSMSPAWFGRREFKQRFRAGTISNHRDHQLLTNELKANKSLLPVLWDIVAEYAKPYRWGADAQLNSRTKFDCGSCRKVMADWALIDDLESLGADTESVVATYFALHGNLFTRLPERMAQKFPHMQRISVRGGLLNFIPQSAFERAHTLEVLDLSYNFLTDIPDMIYELPQLQKLDLEGNPLSEDAKKKYQAWQERRKKLQEGSASGVGANPHANAAATASASK